MAEDERFPDHGHRNLKAFRKHIQKMVSSCLITERYVENFSWLGVRGGLETVQRTSFPCEDEPRQLERQGEQTNHNKNNNNNNNDNDNDDNDTNDTNNISNDNNNNTNNVIVLVVLVIVVILMIIVIL